MCILAEEMKRLELADMAEAWRDVVRRGVCTMDPHIGHWMRKQMGVADANPWIIPIRLTDAFRALLPEHRSLLDGHHDAGNDCQMHWLLAREVEARARA